ncbi:type II secretion system minor pseudopilin GspI [Teredinibacter purpureus]|uniref:type II secretion system minor pseudopilin GspI n=1 Tax=Teredinibacter purpureus TaxID=2731756 RepID=UPI0005F802AC|nr:type II secretion system minor pseudopilin GspI [Teredinibacter purpureus]
MNTTLRRVSGFTLIEVLIALAIVAVALPALVMRVQSVSDNTGYIEQKSYAYWIAQNKMEEIFLDYRIKNTFPKTKRHDTLEFGGKEWYWEVQAVTTGMESIYRIEVRVGNDEDDILASYAGILHESKDGAQTVPNTGTVQ